MKTINFLKVILFALLVLSNAQAARLSDEEKKEVETQLEELIKESKDDKGVINMDRFNTYAFNSLEEFHVDRKITREELLKFKEELERVRVKVAPADREKQIKDLFNANLLAVVQSKGKPLIKVGGQCNHWDCEKGLECAPVPPRVEAKLPKKGGDVECKQDSDCNSGECFERDDGKKVCEYTYKCFRPVKLKSSCLENPICAGGECVEVYFSDANIGACSSNGKSCKKNVECCSDSCVKGKCEENYRCDDCISTGKLKRGQKCCEDKAYEKDGKCLPLTVPLNPFVYILKTVIDVVIPQAHAIMEDDCLTRDDGGNLIPCGGSGSGGPAPTPPPVNANAQYRSGVNSNSAMKIGQGIDQSSINFNGQAEIDRFNLVPDEGSNFETCNINLLNDYAKKLRETPMPGSPNVTMLQVELALLGFEYIAGGNKQIDDYWKGGSSNKTLHKRISEIANKRTVIRNDFYGDLRWFEPKVKCLCLEKTGWKQMTPEQKDEYKNECRLGLAIPPLQGGSPEDIAEYRAKRDELAAQSAMSVTEWNAKISENIRAEEAGEIEEGNDALGIKALELLEAWATANATIEEISLVTANISMTELNTVYSWMQTEAKWSDVQMKDKSLYAFNVKNEGGPSDPMLAIALLSAGVLAIVGGFAFSATISAWTTIGILSLSGASLGAGMWMIGSLRGAWFSAAPYVTDKQTGSYKCGKSDTCFKFQRTLHQPYNTVCNKNISATGCIKHFVVVKENGQDSILVDPWIPQYVEKASIIKDGRFQADLLDTGFNQAYNYMKSSMQSPSDSKAGLWDKSIFQNTVINNQALGKYAPALNNQASNYVVSEVTKKAIVDTAAQFLIDQGWATGTVQAEAFGQYVFKNHFTWAKQTYGDVIAYPAPGLTSYLGLIANGLASQMDFNAGLAGGFRELANSYRGEIVRRGGDFDRDGNRVVIGGRPEGGDLSGLNGDQGAGSGINFGEGTGFGGFGSGSIAGFGNGSGTLSGSSFGDGGFNSSLFSSGVNAALSNLRDFRKAQKSEADEFKKRNAGTERGRNLIESAENFRDQFYTDSLKGNNLGKGGNGSGLGGGSGNSLASGGKIKLGSDGANGDGSGANGKSGLFSEGIGRSNGNGGANGAGGNGVGGFGQFGNDYNNGNSDGLSADGSESGNGVGRNGNMSEEDARKLAEAIKNRNAKDGEYGRKDGMTLWEIVTNTYIRVYDRLLERKSNDLE